MMKRVFAALFVLVVVTAGVGPVAATVHAGDFAAVHDEESTQIANENCSFPVTATDATGTEVTIQQEPQRVVALGASTAQVMWEVGAKNKVVAMPEDSTTAYLDGSRNRTGVFQSDGFTVATEKVVGTNPDLVVAANVIPNETIETLRGAGLTVYKSDFAGSITDVYDDVNRTGGLVGACDGAAKSVNETRTRVNAVKRAVNGTDSPRVLYPQSGGFAVGNNTFINDVIETAGGDNIAADAGIEGYQEISNETIAKRNPQWILTSSPATIPSGEPYASTAALQRNQTVVVNGNLISQPGPRVVIPLTEIARTLHPEAMQQVNVSNATTGPPVAADGGTANTATQTTDTSAETGTTIAATGAESTATGTTASGETTSGGATTAGGAGGTTAGSGGATAAETGASENASGGNGSGGTTSSNGPGFGVAVAAIALLGGALLARRRR